MIRTVVVVVNKLKPFTHALPHLMRDNDQGSSKWLFCFPYATGSEMDRLASIVSVLSEKRYWWESVCNTAQTSGEDSASDTNGCRASAAPSSIVKVFLGLDWERLGFAHHPA